MKKGSPWESVTLTTLSRDRQIFGDLLNEARQLAIDLQEGKTVVYTCWGLEWRPFGQPRRKRPLNSVILDVNVKERIVSDVKDFLSASNYYYERGCSYLHLVPTLTFRHTLSSRIPTARPSRKRQNEFYTSFGRRARLQLVHPQPLRTRPHRRSASPDSQHHTRTLHYGTRRR
jgi:hypothetical protein